MQTDIGTKIKNREYERLPIETRNKIIYAEKIEVKDLVPNPILIKNKNNIEIVSEKQIELEQKQRSIISQIPSYIMSILPTIIMLALFIMIFHVN